MRDFFTILGGMGTLATASFVRGLNQQTPTQSDQDFLDYIVVNHASIPDRTAYILGTSDENPIEPLLADIQRFTAMGTDFFVLTCNTAHTFYEALQASTPIDIVHMPRTAVKAIASHGHPQGIKVGILATAGTLHAGIYQQELTTAGYVPVVPDAAHQAQVNHLIYEDVKQQSHLNTTLLQDICDTFLEEVDALILGCTELSAVYEMMAPDKRLIDAQQATCLHVVERALAIRRARRNAQADA